MLGAARLFNFCTCGRKGGFQLHAAAQPRHAVQQKLQLLVSRTRGGKHHHLVEMSQPCGAEQLVQRMECISRQHSLLVAAADASAGLLQKAENPGQLCITGERVIRVKQHHATGKKPLMLHDNTIAGLSGRKTLQHMLGKTG